MLVYVSGSDSFLARQALYQLKAKYLAKNDGAELLVIDGDVAQPTASFADLQAVPLFASSRLVIVRQAGALPAESQRALAHILTNVPATTVAAVWDGAKKLTSELAAALLAAPKIIDVQPLNYAQRQRHVRARATALGLELTATVLNELADYQDLWRIETELAYVATAGDSQAATHQPAASEPFAYFNLTRRQDWTGLGRQLAADFNQGQPFELLLGSLAAAVRKNVTDPTRRLALTELMSDVDFGVKTGLLEPAAGLALVSFHLPKPAQSRVQWERLWEETIS